MIHNLFFAVLPDEATAKRIAALGARLQDQLGLTGTRLPAARLHVTLYGLGRHEVGDAPPADVVARAVEAAGKVAMGPFDVQFDHVAGFSGDGRTMVMRGGEKLSKLFELREAMTVASGARKTPPFEPHVTLMYADRIVPETDIEPISWTVSEFVLIDSLQGRGRHLRLHRWPLLG